MFFIFSRKLSFSMKKVQIQTRIANNTQKSSFLKRLRKKVFEKSNIKPFAEKNENFLLEVDENAKYVSEMSNGSGVRTRNFTVRNFSFTENKSQH